MLYASGCPRGTLFPSVALAGLSTLALTGCEAPLNLDAVHQQSQQAIQRTDFYQAVADNDQVIVVAGNTGVLLARPHGSEHWQRVAAPTHDSFIDLDSCPDGSFVALTFSNQVWHGDASASHWTTHDLPSSEQMMALTCAPDNAWWTAGSFTTLQHSADQGASWQEVSLQEDAILTNVQFLDADTAIATGEYGLLLKSEDGGSHWEIGGYLPDEFYPHASHFRSADEGWVGGLNGFIYHTTDGGQSWTRQATDTSVPVFGFVTGGHELLALGDNSTVLRLQGNQWRSVDTPNQPLYLRGGVLLENRQLLAAGGRGLLLNLDIPTAVLASKK